MAESNLLLNTNSQSYDVALWRRLAFQHSIHGSLLLPGWFVNVSDSRMFGFGIQGVWDCWGPVFRGADCDIIKRNVVSVLFEGFQFSPLRPSRQRSCASSVLSVWWLVVRLHGRSTATNGGDIWGKPKPFRNLNLFLLTCYALCFDDTSCIPASWTLVRRSRQPLSTGKRQLWQQ